MTPKEKAEDLLSKYYFQVQTLVKQKQCALIAVDEILETNPYKARNYWQQVKQEIENL
jgi:homoserine trans-succinylase